MEYLLDNHVYLWFIDGNSELSTKAKEIISNPENIKFVSIVRFWEIAIKLKIEKIKIDMPFIDLKNQALINGFQILPLLFEDTRRLTTLQLHNRDPFDRMLISQALQNNLYIISKDPEFMKYTNNVIW